MLFPSKILLWRTMILEHLYKIHLSYRYKCSLGYTPRNEITGSKGMHLYNFKRITPSCFPKWVYQFIPIMTMYKHSNSSVSCQHLVFLRLHFLFSMVKGDYLFCEIPAYIIYLFLYSFVFLLVSWRTSLFTGFTKSCKFVLEKTFSSGACPTGLSSLLHCVKLPSQSSLLFSSLCLCFKAIFFISYLASRAPFQSVFCPGNSTTAFIPFISWTSLWSHLLFIPLSPMSYTNHYGLGQSGHFFKCSGPTERVINTVRECAQPLKDF